MIARQSAIAGMTEEEFSDVRLFRERAQKLAAAQAKYQNVPIATFDRDAESNQIVFDANTPDVDDVISIAVKFRFFYADKEPTQFEKILTKVRRRMTDEWACGYMDALADWYRSAMRRADTSQKLGHPIPNRQIINLWFNSEFFHSAPEKRRELDCIHDAIGEHPSLFQLYTAIALCSSYVKMLYVVVHQLEAGHEFVYSPNHHFGRTVAPAAGDV